MDARQITKIRQALEGYIQNNGEYFRSPDVESGNIPQFLIHTSKGSDKETLNLYFNYKTSKQFISRAIFSLGHWDDFSTGARVELETLAVIRLREMGIKAKRAKE